MARLPKTSSRIEEDPILHTPGGEMPDPNDTHHVRRDDLEGDTEAGISERALKGLSGAQDIIDNVRDYAFPVLLGVGGLALAIGGYFLYQKLRESRFHEEGDLLNEGKSADDINPEKLMGA